MSKEYVRQLVTSRLAQFEFGDFVIFREYFNNTTKLDKNTLFKKPVSDFSRKSFPNMKDGAVPPSGNWLRLRDIEFVLHKVASIGSEPCTRRTGVIVIDVFERLDSGTKRITELTDALEEWFGLWTATNFWTDPANTVNKPNDGDKNGYYLSTVYVPFTYDED